MDYDACLAIQHRLVASLKADPLQGEEWLLMVEHDPVVTLGRRADVSHVLSDGEVLESEGIDLRHVERGGDVTYHGPGQLVVYPILDLRRHRRDVRWYSRSLLEAARRTAAAFGLEAEIRDAPETGLWVDGRKIGAIGVRIERWITYHGLSLNVAPDLTHYRHIVPCGLATGVTSMAAALGRPVEMATVAEAFQQAFADVFNVSVEAGVPEEVPWPTL